MIKLGHIKDADAVSLPMCIDNSVREDLKMLDCYYGEDRDIDRDMGGFVVICDGYEELRVQSFDINTEIPEYTERIGDYEKSLYISGTERNIVIYRCLNDGRMLHK